jgi:hypothetical protein
MLGLVLAAGDATRMPNKCMLSTPEGRPLFMDAVMWFHNAMMSPVVVCKPDSVVAQYCDTHGIAFMFQYGSKGVVDAIKSGLNDFVVAFGDCYGYRDLDIPIRNHATVINESIEGLDGWCRGRWVYRDLPKEQSFSGAFHCDAWRPTGNCLMTEFNRHGIVPFYTKGVQDCGTPEGYKKIWRRS